MIIRILSGYIIKLKISAVFAALFCFLLPFDLMGAMPLTETIYTVPDGGIVASSNTDFIKINKYYRRETFNLGICVLHDISVWYSFQYLHQGTVKTSASEPGDSFFKIWYYAGDYLEGSFHTGLLLSFRIPTGADSYAGSKWRNLAFGNNELKIGPVFQADILKNIFIHLNAFYIFRQGIDEGFYSGLSIDLFDKNTYTNLFGFNFRSEDAFLAGKRLKNDYAAFSCALNTDMLYPLIVYIEMYKSQRIYKRQSNIDKISIEGAGINPLFISAGFRYFFRESLFAGLFYITNPAREENYIKDIWGFDLSLVF